MNWLLSILSGVVCAAAGALCAGYVADGYAEWYRISGREGESGYFVVMIGVLGFVAGFIIGVVAARTAGAGGAAKGFGAGLGLVLGIAGVSWLVARALGDVPPRLRGDTLYVMTELRCPPGWKPMGRTRIDYSTLRLEKLDGATRGRTPDDGQLEWKDARQEDGRWVVPARVSLFTTTGRRGLTFILGGHEVARFVAPIPAHPDASLEKWSPWLPPGAEGFSYRFRVQLRNDMLAEWNGRAYAEQEAQTEKLMALWKDPAGQAAGLRSKDRARIDLVLTSFQGPKGTPAECIGALREAAEFIAAEIRRFRETTDPANPDAWEAAELKRLFSEWCSAWERAVREHHAGVPGELDAIAKEAAAGAKLDGEIESIASSCDYYRKQWTAQ
jgi:hypothetical protein